MKDLINLNYISDRLEEASPEYKKMNKDMKDIPTWFKITSAVTAGSLLATACNPSGVQPTISTEQGNNFNPNETTQAPEQNAYKSHFSWKSDRTKETAENAGVPVESVSGYQITIDGAATADGKLKIDFNNFTDPVSGEIRSVYYSPLYDKNVNEIFISTKDVDGQTIVQKQYYTSTGEVKTILEYAANSSSKLAAGQDVTVTVFPDDIQSAMIRGYDGNGIKVEVSPNPDWVLATRQSELYHESFVEINVNNVNTQTPSESSTVTPAPSETPSSTVTPETVEVNQFKVCTPENFRDCKITADQLMDGTYLNWLRTLSQPFDQTQIRTDISLADYRDENDKSKYIIYKITANDVNGMFTGQNEGKEPFRRDVTSGYVDYTDDQGREWKYIVRPIEFFDKNNPTVNQWVITVQAFPMWWHNYTDSEIDNVVKIWKDEMNLTPILCTDKFKDQDFTIPLVHESFLKFDMESKFVQFAGKVGVDPDDVSALSAPGIILPTETSITALYK